MKKHTLLYICSLLIVAASSMMPVYAQQPKGQYALYNYRNDGCFNAWLNIDIDSITYSRIDTLGVEHDDVVVQEVWTPDSLYRIPLEAIDSIGFRAPEPEMASDIFYIRDYHAGYTTSIEELTIHFSNTIHRDSIPSVGQVILSATEVNPYEEGFAGKVMDVQYSANGISIVCEAISIGDIYKRLVVVGKVSNDIMTHPSGIKGRRNASEPWVNIAEDGVVPINLKEKVFPIGDILKIISPTPKLTCSYYVYISELWYEVYVQLDLHHPDLTYQFTLTNENVSNMAEFGKLFVSRFSDEEALDKWIEEYKSKKIKEYKKEQKEDEEELSKQWFERSKIKIPIPVPTSAVLNLELEISPIVKAKGKFEIVSEFKTDAWQSMSMKWKGFTPVKILSSNLGISDIPTVNITAHQDPIKSAKLDLKAKGTLTMGFKTLLNANVIHKKLIYAGLACDFALAEVGGTLDVTILDTEQPEMNLYDRLKDTNLKVSTYAQGYAEVGLSPYKFLSASTPKAELYSDEAIYYLMPHFTEPVLPKFNNGHWESKQPLSFFSYPSKNIFIPCQIGMRIEDEDGNVKKEYQEKTKYKDELGWRNEYIDLDISDIPRGANYKCYPTISFFGLEPFNAGPVHKFAVPLSMVASPAELTLEVGKSDVVEFFGGWDTFAAVISGEDEVASIINDGSTTTRQVKIVGKKVGKSELQIEDRRTGEKILVPITVTDEPIIPGAFSVSHTAIDFGIMTEGKTAKRRFKVTNDGESTITIQASCESDYFKLSDNKAKFTLAKGESKDYTVTCNGLPTSGDVNAVITITSDGDAESQRITLSAKGEESDVPADAPSIPVETETIVVKGVPFTMIGVEGGSFMMGSPDDDPDAGGIYSDEKPQHEVKLSNFAIGQTEVTQALWKVVMGENPSMYQYKGYKKPVENVSWNLCQIFISKLNALTGRTFRLPTEAEWEYAARGGKYSKGYKYAGSNDVNAVAWNTNNSGGNTHVVGTKDPNELGLYDMSGNVWEWCQDWHYYYSESPVINPCNTTESSSDDEREHQHIHRGGSINYVIKDLRTTMRGDYYNDPSLYLKGLRLVLSDGKTGYKETEAEDEAYAELNNGVLGFYCDGERFSKTGETYEMPDYLEPADWSLVEENGGLVVSKEWSSKITRVFFDSSFAKARPKCTMGWFINMSSITEIEGLKYLNTSEVTYMSEMFYGCSNLKSLDVSHFNTSKVTYMGYMFDECSNLTYLDVSNFNTSKVTSMESMFRKCSSLTTLNVSNFNTSNVTDMSRMFAGCSNLMTLDVSNFNTSNVESMDAMFWSCSNLSILDVSHFITSNVRNMAWMFESCGKLKSLKVNNFDTSNVTDMEYMFYGCSELSEINVSNFNTSNVHNMAWMFAFCNSVTSIDISTFDISSLVDEYAENALQGMFYGCTNLKTIKCGELWNMKSTAYSSDMFKGCFNLVGGKQTKYDENRTDGEYARIDGGVNNPGYFTDINATILPSGAVDLGLPSGTLWGSCNVGASRPEEFGGYYAWGETEEKSEYTSDNYLYKDKNLGRNINGTEYDVAHVKLGGNWQMPTRKQIEELINKCSREVATINGVAGMKFIGTNGNSIFLPFNEEFFDSVFGVYWTSTSNTNTNSPFDLFVDEDGSVSCFESNSEMGRAVRPVEVSRMKPYSITITPAEEEVDFGAVKQDTEKTETFIVTNTGNADLTFHVDGSTEFTRFEVSDNMKSYTLAPGESKTYTVTAHGMEAGYKASTLLFVKSDNGEEETKVSLLAIGTDDEPLINKTSLTMTVGERASIRLKTPLYSAEADDYNIVDYMGGGPGETMRWDDGYESEVSHSSSGLTFTALKAGVVHVTFTEKYTNKKEVLTITVTQDPEVAGPGEDTISETDEV